MREISRVSLYINARNFIENIEFRNNRFLTEFSLHEREIIDNLLRFNIYILDGIENYFLISNDDSIISIDTSELTKVYLDKVNYIDINFYKGIISRNDIKKMQSIVDNNENKIEDTTKKGRNKDIYYLFNSIINVLNEINNKVLDGLKIQSNYFSRDSEVLGKRFRNQVFLSHAFDDKLYTFSLFVFMLEEDIFLYVDWIFSPEFDNGEWIKLNLSERILDSDQLLFLRTVNSELSIRGSGNIRGWCSWELGTFYSIKNKNDKFYIELYRSKTNQKRNKQLDGIKPLKGIDSGRLV
ncbi:hypothetical protein [Peptostreptococcus sp.]